MRHFQAFFTGSQAAGRTITFILRGEKNKISCAKDAELRDNNFNIGGLAIWDGIGRMHGNDQFETVATAAVSQTEYFALQRLPNRVLTDRP
jgi:hypothetical protein